MLKMQYNPVTQTIDVTDPITNEVVSIGAVQSPVSPVVSGTANAVFGDFPGLNQVDVAITGQTGILATSAVTASIDTTGTTEFESDELRWMSTLISVTVSKPTAGVGFTVQLNSDEEIQGTIPINWSWQ